jgi:hypothetical protein
MKKSQLELLSLLCVVAVAAGGCAGDDTVTTPRNDTPALDSAAFSVVDAEDAYAKVEDATLETDMVMGPVFINGQFLGHGPYRDRPGAHLGWILRELEVTREQVRQMLGFVKAYWQAILPQLEGLREANREIIDAANRIRMEIRRAVEQGEITREEAEQRLKQLNMRTREAIRNNPANEPYLRAICEAKRALFRSVRSVLDDRQQAKWDRWVAGLEGPCFGN